MGDRGLAIVVAALAIIGVLAVYEFFFSRSPADLQRMKDMRTLQDALAAYHKDKSLYPPAPGGDPACKRLNVSLPWNNVAGLAGVLVPNYLTAIPKDPNPASCDMNYLYVANGPDDYAILVHLDELDMTKYPDGWCIGAAAGPGPLNAYSHHLRCP